MNDDGTRPNLSPEDTALAHELMRRSSSNAWAFLSANLAMEHPDFTLTPEMEFFVQMGIVSGQVGTIEAVRDMGLA